MHASIVELYLGCPTRSKRIFERNCSKSVGFAQPNRHIRVVADAIGQYERDIANDVGAQFRDGFRAGIRGPALNHQRLSKFRRFADIPDLVQGATPYAVILTNAISKLRLTGTKTDFRIELMFLAVD